LQEGVMYFVFKPENNIVDSEKLVEQSYKLLSTAPEAQNGSFGASYLELFRTVDDSDGSKDNSKAKRVSSILNLGWRVEKARSLAIDKNQISTTEHNYQTKGLVVFRDVDPLKGKRFIKTLWLWKTNRRKFRWRWTSKNHWV
uniref:hypothetical protein n=1 Tax=Mesomycoplasma ovipneumoniae TaxID=29562 RepID=UPI0030802065